MRTIRDMVYDLINQITPDMHLVEATEKMLALSKLTGNIGEEILVRERAFIAKKVELMSENDKMSMNKLDLLAQNSDEYQKLGEVKVLEKTVISIIQSLKYKVKSLQDEYKTTQ